MENIEIKNIKLKRISISSFIISLIFFISFIIASTYKDINEETMFILTESGAVLLSMAGIFLFYSCFVIKSEVTYLVVVLEIMIFVILFFAESLIDVNGETVFLINTTGAIFISVAAILFIFSLFMTDNIILYNFKDFTLESINNEYNLKKYLGNEITFKIPKVVNINRKTIKVKGINSNAFLNCNSLTNITIPDNIVSIGCNAFSECNNLTVITIPDSVTSITSSIFSGCNSLKNIKISNSVTSIGDAAFSRCSKLTDIIIPDSVTSIGDYAFSNCINLKSITLPENLTILGASVFYGCISLKTVYIKKSSIASLIEGNYSMFENCSDELKICVPDEESVIAYKQAEYWSDYADKIYKN